ncbi:hypothetical protein AB2M62_01365 [Sphingomonas sp. MMS12-HWE2-04]|uniref:hypothetical protein n=1 Tax=Sphingomonas sp. MMS12-HWE2-04 TaxID=3234199 RepID=UPI00384C9F6D
MTSPGRRVALCAQTVKALTGIDFVQVVDPADQRLLRVFFVIEPDLTSPAMIATAQVPALPPAVDEGAAAAVAVSLTVRVETATEGLAAEIAGIRWRRVRTVIDSRVALEIQMVEPGGFEPYRLVLDHARLDPLSDTILFDFKQGCETGFDCEVDSDCPGDALVDVDIDYLARDFDSLRRALLDFANLRYPNWKEPLEADFGTMMFEIMAAMGDHFAYQQDRIDTETRFGSATQRASLAAHAKLVDYRPFRGSPASGPIAFTAIAGGIVPADSRVWTRIGGDSPIAFSTLADAWVHPFWNALPAHNPDPGIDCIGHGATSLMLRSAAAVAAQTPMGVTRAEFLIGKRVMILSDPADPARPRRAVPVTITGFSEFLDPLVLTAGSPTFVTEIRWSADEALSVELPYDGLSVAMNLADVAAGERVVEYFRIGDDAALSAHQGAIAADLAARMRELSPAIEREGPLERAEDGRDILFRYGLTATEGTSLRHLPSGLPDISVMEVVPGALPSPLPTDDLELFGLFVSDTAWTYIDDLLDGDLDSENFTVEPGMWRTVQRHQLRFGSFAFRDYAADSGWTLRFGSGDFGRAPPDGAVLRVIYRTDPGVIANIPSQSLTLTPPPGITMSPTLAALVGDVTNPLPFSNALPPETATSIRTNAPEAFRAVPRRAVRPEDYETILGKLPFVQRANAVTCWTGSWSTDFFAVDPFNAVSLTPAQQATVDRELDCIRLAARDVRRLEADYLDIDLDISICITAEASPGDVIEAVEFALRAFLAPDRFTFGTPLIRSALEAAAQAVPGVRFVDAIRIRVHGFGNWRPFTEAELVPAANQIVRLQDDPDRAAMGILSVHSDKVAAGGA